MTTVQIIGDPDPSVPILITMYLNVISVSNERGVGVETIPNSQGVLGGTGPETPVTDKTTTGVISSRDKSPESRKPNKLYRRTDSDRGVGCDGVIYKTLEEDGNENVTPRSLSTVLENTYTCHWRCRCRLIGSQP